MAPERSNSTASNEPHVDPFIDYDEDSHDFEELLYLQSKKSEAEVVDSWRFLTKLKDTINPVHARTARRLENASWRRWSSGRLPESMPIEDPSKYAIDDNFKFGLESKSIEDDSLVGRALDFIKSIETTVSVDDDETEGGAQNDSERKQVMLLHFEHLVKELKLKEDQIQSLLNWIHSAEFYQGHLPESVVKLRETFSENRKRVMVRPVCALFSHSLQRNGANNFLLYLVRGLLAGQRFELYSPSDGPMRSDFEDSGVKVFVTPANSPDAVEQLKNCLLGESALGCARPGLCIANTIMRAEIIKICNEIGIPSLWVIHEAWPQAEFEYYAKEVFMMKHIDGDLIRSAFSMANRVIFPSYIQRNLYKGLFDEARAETIYNGIPLTKLRKYKKQQDRREVRAEMGYKEDDFVVLHLGTVCARKAQLSSTRAFAKLVQQDRVPGGVDELKKFTTQTNLKLLIVGCRYIRDHEIKYIDQIKRVITDNELHDQVQLIDIQKNVLKYYMAADVVLVPSRNEVLPLVVCESMAFEIPVIASRIDGIPEAMDDNVEGFLIPAADADSIADRIDRLRKSPLLRARMGANGKKRVNNQFSFGNMSAQYRIQIDKLYEEAVSANPNFAPVMSPATGLLKPFQKGTQQLKGKTVLVDMDNTLVDWDKEFIKRWVGHCEDPAEVAEFTFTVRQREHFEIEKNFDESLGDKVMEVIKSPGFYFSLEPFPGAVEVLKTMVQQGINIRLVTAPHPSCAATCAAEKFQWVEKHFGPEWLDRLIICRDKTHVSGDIIVDDKPKITGNATPSWNHVLFTQSYNVHQKRVLRMSNWDDWKMVLPAALY